MVASVTYCNSERVTVAPLGDGYAGGIYPSEDGYWFLVADRVPAEHRLCVVRHVGRHLADAAALDDVVGWCETATCAWAGYWLGTVLQPSLVALGVG